MATTLLLEHLEGGLHPVDEDGRTALRAIKEGVFVKVKLSIPRNVRMHRLFFAILKLTFEHQREPRVYPTIDALREALTMAVGHTREVRGMQPDPRTMKIKKNIEKVLINTTNSENRALLMQAIDNLNMVAGVYLIPDSISFGRMDQIAFRQFFDAVIRLIIDRIVPGVGKQDFERRLYEMLKEPGPDSLERR